jgi:rhodanese-related sulfurtransferase
LLGITTGERYISTDEVAARIIEKDPSLRLVDVRSRDAFKSFSLPGAYNVPLSAFLNTENLRVMDCDRYDVVFFSNDDLDAEHAWQMSRRLGCAGSLIMRGGLNEWTGHFLVPAEPSASANSGAVELYRFRKAVCQYLIGASNELLPEKLPAEQVNRAPAAARKRIEVQPKAKNPPGKAQEEGC